MTGWGDTWADIDRLKQRHADLEAELNALGWSLVEPEDVFIVARRRAWKGWAPRPTWVKARTPEEVLAEVKRLEAEFAEAQKASTTPAAAKGQG